MNKLVLALAACAVLAAPAASKPRTPPPITGEEAVIPFANLRGGIRSFHADDRDTVYLQDRSRDWYKAEIAGTCINLPWATRIGIDSRFGSTFQRGSTLIVEGDRCMAHTRSR
jgi:hypothetical protein